MTPEQLGYEARRLLADATLNEALAQMRSEACEALVMADANEPTKVLRAQCAVRAVDEFKDMLGRFIEALPAEE